MKTAIEQMIKDLHDTFPRFFNVHSVDGRVFMRIAIKYLAVEKEQIFEAYDAGVNLEYCLDMSTPKEYYEQTYGGHE